MFYRKKKRIIETIKARYGKDPLQTPAGRRCRDRLEQVRIFYDTFRNSEGGTEYDIDDITWSDLEMDELFLRINQTGSYIGEQVLYQTLHSGKDSFFTENRELMKELGQNEKVRQKLAFRLFSIGKVQQSYLYLIDLGFISAELHHLFIDLAFRVGDRYDQLLNHRHISLASLHFRSEDTDVILCDRRKGDERNLFLELYAVAGQRSIFLRGPADKRAG